MDDKAKKICHGCKFINQQTANQHCYMFRDAPTSTCFQHTELKTKPLVNSAAEFAVLLTGDFSRISEQ